MVSFGLKVAAASAREPPPHKETERTIWGHPRLGKQRQYRCCLVRSDMPTAGTTVPKHFWASSFFRHFLHSHCWDRAYPRLGVRSKRRPGSFKREWTGQDVRSRRHHTLTTLKQRKSPNCPSQGRICTKMTDYNFKVSSSSHTGNTDTVPTCFGTTVTVVCKSIIYDLAAYSCKAGLFGAYLDLRTRKLFQARHGRFGATPGRADVRRVLAMSMLWA